MTGAPSDRETLQAFSVDVPAGELRDLDLRLDRTRWPDELPGTAWDYGVPQPYLRDLVEYWRNGYDWRAEEARLNAIPQFLTTIDGQRLHFLHARSPEADALPLVVLHGWPGSVFEFLDVVGPLTDPVAHGGDRGDAFHLVIPSLPGYGFSGPTVEKGWNFGRIARAVATLMQRLGYGLYGAQGGDIGALVAPELAHADPDHVAGVHVNAASYGFIPFGDVPESELATFTERERASLERMQRFFSPAGSAYFQVQSSRPQMIGYALTDSPVGQLAWAVDRMADWTHGPIERALTREQILSNVMAYWTTRTAASAARLYYENMHAAPQWGRPRPATPVGVAASAEDVAIRRYGEQGYNITHWTDFDEGGHFAAMEAPDVFTADVRAFFRTVR